MNRHTIRVLQLSALAMVPVALWAFSAGPPVRRTGAQVDGGLSCNACHAVGAPDLSLGKIAIRTTAYTPGFKQTVEVEVSHPNAQRWGFQLTARLASDPTKPAGTLTVSPGIRVRCDGAGADAPCETGVTQFAEHTRDSFATGANGTKVFQVEWTPPATDVGPVIFYAAGNAANGNGNNQGDAIYTGSLEIQRAASSPKPTITQNGVANGASFANNIAPNSWISIRGTELAAVTRENRADEIVGGRRPTSMDGVSVTINNKPAFFYYISPTQLNLVSPDDDATGPVPVKISRAGVESEIATVTLQKYSPAFFLWPGNQAVATNQSFEIRAKAGTFSGVTSAAAKPGDVIILWGTGFGATTPPVAAGTVVTGTASVTTPVRVTIGGTQAEYIGTALAPGFTALYQVAVRVPDVPNGDHPVIATIEGASSPATTLLTVQR